MRGKTIDFLETDKDASKKIVQGKITAAATCPITPPSQAYGPQYYAQQAAYAQVSEQPVVEVNGNSCKFSLPASPFSRAGRRHRTQADLSWETARRQAGLFSDGVSVTWTGGITWDASYNVVATSKSNALELVAG
jgi:hypothetical protein